MKKMKKFLSVLLASAMTLAMAAPGFADTTTNISDGKTGTITVDNPQKEVVDGKPTETSATYTAYKIFDVTYNEQITTPEPDKSDYSNYAYSIPVSSAWFEVVTGMKKEALKPEDSANGLKFTKAAAEDTYYVTRGEDFSAAKFAAILKTALDNGLEDPEASSFTYKGTGDNTVASVNNLDLGYYFVSTNSGSLCNLTTTNNDIHIHDKNEAQDIDKNVTKIEYVEVNGKKKTNDNLTDGKNVSVEVGSIVTFTITGDVPDTTGYTNGYFYKVSDNMDAGLSFNKDVTVEINNKEIKLDVAKDELGAKDEGIVYNDNGFELQLNLYDNNKYAIGEDNIVITYTAKVTPDAATMITKNTAALNYSRDPQTGALGDKPNPDKEVKLYVSQLVIDKYQITKENMNETEIADATRLNGAKFVLYKEDANNKKLYYKYDETNKEVSWVESYLVGDDFVAGTVVTTGKVEEKDGVAKFVGLEDGIYKLMEVEAPTGYNLLNVPVTVEIKGKEEVAKLGSAPKEADVKNALTNTAAVGNNTGAQLPSTGGIGTTIFYAVGIILMAGAVFFVVRRKRA